MPFWSRKTSPRLEETVSDLKAEVREMRSDMKLLESEWNGYYESLRNLEGKLSKRAKRANGDCGCAGESVQAPASPANMLAAARQKYTFGRS